ncbi:MAG: hypothetical protein AAB177_10225, partial [Nitrospirota bacterium]
SEGPRWTRAVEDQSGPIPKLGTSKLGMSITSLFHFHDDGKTNKSVVMPDPNFLQITSRPTGNRMHGCSTCAVSATCFGTPGCEPPAAFDGHGARRCEAIGRRTAQQQHAADGASRRR